MDQGLILGIINFVHLGAGLLCGVLLSKKYPFSTKIRSISLLNSRARLLRFVTKNSEYIFIVLGTVLGFYGLNILTDEYYKTIIDVILGLLAASGLIFTFILGHLLNVKKGLQDTIINLQIKKVEHSARSGRGVRVYDDMLLETETEINRITGKMQNAIQNGLAIIAFYFLAFLSILLRPFYEESLNNVLLLNILMFNCLFLGFSFLFKLMYALDD